MASPKIKFMSLQKSELEYEVSIRGETPASTVQELRKQIAKSASLYPSEDILTSPFSVSEDLAGVLDILARVSSALQPSADEKTVDRSTLLRTQNLLNHLHHRLIRITPDANSRTSYDESVKLFKDAVIRCNSLLDSSTDHLTATSSSVQSTVPSTTTDPINVSVTCEGRITSPVFHAHTTEAATGPKGNCSCGGYPTTTPKAGEEPIISQSPGLVVNCDKEGSNTCMALCTALATATKAKGPKILCKRLKNAHELTLSAFSKICDEPWSYANMTAEEPLCCTNSQDVMCPSVAQKGNRTVISV